MSKGYEKAAAILSLLGDELSQKILINLPEDMAVAIISASEKLKTPTREELLGLVSEFSDGMQRAGSQAVPSGGGQSANDTGITSASTPLEIIENSSSIRIAEVIKGERSEIAAYVLSHLPVEKIYEILTMLGDTKDQVESKLIALKDVPIAKELEDRILKSVSERLV